MQFFDYRYFLHQFFVLKLYDFLLLDEFLISIAPAKDDAGQVRTSSIKWNESQTFNNKVSEKIELIHYTATCRLSNEVLYKVLCHRVSEVAELLGLKIYIMKLVFFLNIWIWFLAIPILMYLEIKLKWLPVQNQQSPIYLVNCHFLRCPDRR